MASVSSPGASRAAASSGAQGVLPEVDARRLLLRQADLPREEREERRQQAGLGQHAEATRRCRHGQHLAQLLADALGRDRGGVRCSRAQRRERGRLDLEVELGGQADGPQQAQGVLVEALGRIADRADDPGREVALAAGGVDQLEVALAAAVRDDGIASACRPYARALMVKSRRARSSSRDSENSTRSGRRRSRYSMSRRKVVTSTARPRSTGTSTVPKRFS